MLQIVIWMLCVYLLVKGFEILSNPVQRNALGLIGTIIAWLAAPVFFILSIEQTKSMKDNPLVGQFRASTSGDYGDTTSPDAQESTSTEVEDAEEASRAANRALDDAANAIENAGAAVEAAGKATE